MIELIELNLSSKCKRKRIHHTGSNPRSGFTGLTLKPREQWSIHGKEDSYE